MTGEEVPGTSPEIHKRGCLTRHGHEAGSWRDDASSASYRGRMPETPDEIAALLRQAQASDPAVAEFAWVWLDAFRRDVQDVVRQHRQEGRAQALRGEDPDPVRERTEERLEEVRQRLLGRLRRLMTWARKSGRAEE